MSPINASGKTPTKTPIKASIMEASIGKAPNGASIKAPITASITKAPIKAGQWGPDQWKPG